MSTANSEPSVNVVFALFVSVQSERRLIKNLSAKTLTEASVGLGTSTYLYQLIY